MKKAYSKPDVLFDSFSMSQSIANACEIRANHQKGICGVVFTESITIFNSDARACTLRYEDEQYDGLCYHVPHESYNVFQS
jgi:hypothetical protein